MASNNRSPFSIVNGVVTYNGVPENLVPDAQRQSAYGRLGNINFGYGTNFDPRFYDETVSPADDSGRTSSDYRLKPEYQRWDGLMQVGIPRSVGGYSEVRDPSQIFWDDDLGYVTRASNFNGPDEGGLGGFLSRNLVPMLALGGLGAIGMTGGFSGLLGGAGSTGLGSYGAMTTGLDGLTGTLAGEAALGAGGGALATIPEGLLQNITIPPLEIANPTLASIEGLGGTAPWYSTLLQNAQANLSNPMTVARGLLGAANLANNLSGSNSSGTPGLIDGGVGVGNAPRLNFSQLSSYTPMQFDPVPFMSGRYGG